MTNKQTIADFGTIMENLQPMVEGLLAKQKTFHPVAVMISSAGEVMFVAVEVDLQTTKGPDIQSRLLQVLREEVANGQVRAIGYSVDQTARQIDSNKPINLARFYLEASDGTFDSILLPYKRGWLSGLKFEEPFFDENVQRQGVFQSTEPSI